MARLVESDYRKAFDVLYAAGEVDGPLAFPEPVLGVLRELVPCDVVTFHERSWRPGRVLVYTGEPIGPLTPDVRAARQELALLRQQLIIEHRRQLTVEFLVHPSSSARPRPPSNTSRRRWSMASRALKMRDRTVPTGQSMAAAISS